MKRYLLLLLCFPFTLVAQTPCHPDFDALMALYNSTDGANWTNNAGWVDGAAGTDCNVCSWHGVICNSNNRARTVFLHNRSLVGTIPPEIEQLTELEELSLSNNLLTGNIPIEFSNLTNLRDISVQGNQLSGSIPIFLQNLMNLQYLNLSGNQFTGSIPLELGNLVNLESLVLGSNQLSGSIPSQLGNLSNLKTLSLLDNQLSGNIPIELGMLSNLGFLTLENNQLTGNIPTEFGNLDDLDIATLSHNQLSGSIPPELGNLFNISILDISNNQLSGCIPSNLISLCNPDIDFYLSNNPGLPGGGDFAAFCSTNAGDCNPACHPDFDELMAIYNATDGANWTNNTGWIDGAAGTDCNVCNWYGVTCNADNRVWQLQLSSNQLNGVIPAEIGRLIFLELVYLNDNQLSGIIPFEIGNVIKLITLILHNNQLSGTIPATLGKQSDLVFLTINNNQLTGNIPDELGLTSLGVLLLNDNQLVGNIPSELGNLETLTQFNLANNQLTGSIPSSLGNLINLNYFYLNDNQLSGCFHPFLASLCSVASLDISNNVGLPGGGDFNAFCTNNTGVCNLPISSCHPDYEALVALYNATDGANWTYNNGWLNGAAELNCNVCDWYGVYCDDNNRVRELHLNSNQLNGILPSELGSLTELKSLRIEGNNNLIGTIPAELGNLTKLQELGLQANQLSGSIPVELTNLTYLQSIRLSLNQLNGCIPSELGNMSSLYGLSLNDNQLEGCFPSNLLNLCGKNINTFNNPNLPNNGDFPAFCSSSSGACALELDLKMMLGGPYDTGTGLMKDDLRQASLVPMTFGGSTITDANLLSTTGSDAIIDWVNVEVREASNPGTIVDQQAALLQSDGDIVNVDGKSLVIFDILPPGSYHVAIRHRNHLGVMSSTTVTVN